MRWPFRQSPESARIHRLQASLIDAEHDCEAKDRTIRDLLGQINNIRLENAALRERIGRETGTVHMPSGALGHHE